jgi:TctA family transporter
VKLLQVSDRLLCRAILTFCCSGRLHAAEQRVRRSEDMIFGVLGWIFFTQPPSLTLLVIAAFMLVIVAAPALRKMRVEVFHEVHEATCLRLAN